MADHSEMLEKAKKKAMTKSSRISWQKLSCSRETCAPCLVHNRIFMGLAQALTLGWEDR